MAKHGIRRLPVLRADGRLDGVVSLDDMLQHESVQFWNLVRVVAHEQRRERQVRK
jgi:CBS-domain-containing membrane protein